MTRSRLFGAVALAALVLPGPAAAHIRTGTIAVDYRVTIDRAPPGVSARVFPGDRSLRLAVVPGHTVTVRGYLGEPFLRIGPSGVTVDRASPTAAAAKARASGWSVVWHDARVRGTRPGRWTIPLVVDGRRTAIGGMIERVPRPAIWLWLAIGVPFVAASALLLRRRRLPDLEVAGLAFGGLVAAAIAVAAAGFALDSNATEGRWVEAANEVVFVAVGVAVLARGRPQARVLAAGALGLLGLAVGVSKIPVFEHGIVLAALPDQLVRGAVALMLWASAAAVAIGAAVFVEALDDQDPRAATQLRGPPDVRSSIPRLPLLLALVVPVAAGCGSSRHAAPAPAARLVEERLGRGADEVWIFRPSGPPRSLVVFVHGLGEGETTPVNHRPWLEHLALEGSAVIYPRYERTLGSAGAVRHIVTGVRLALGRLSRPRVPLVAIGYSRGGELVADYAAVARLTGVVPAEVLTVFPAGQDPADPPLDLRTVDTSTRFTILVGDHDSVVDGAGAHQLLGRLAAADFPASHVSVAVVRSHGGFVATHTSPIEVTPAAKAAFWARADRIVARARAG